MLANSIGKKTYMEVVHYKFTYMLSHVGPKYEDLVEIYCHAHWHQPDPRFRLEDVWRTGKLLPLDHPEILYLPPILPGSTPKKPNLIPSQAREGNPELEDTTHQELVDLVKELLQERANRPTSTNPSKDIPLAGHVRMNQESFVQSSQAILQGLAEGGYIHAKTPKFEYFFGDDKNKSDFDMWERQILSVATNHSSVAIKQAMMQSLKGQALAVTTALPPDTTWEKLLQALKIKYQEKAPYDVLMAQFYGTKMEPDEKCASFGTRLEQKLNQVTLQYPDKIPDTMYWNCVRERFFHGLSKNMRTNLRPQFDGGANYYKLLELARMIKSENFYEDAKAEAKPTNQKGKAKVDVVTIDNTVQQIQQLQGAVKGLTKLIQGSRQNTQPQQIPQFVPQLVQDYPNTLPQASQNQSPAHPQGGRGSRGGFRGRGRGRGGLILCYWCRDFLPKEQANHKVANCPYQNQARDAWWKKTLGNGITLPTGSIPSPVGNLSGNTQQEDQENCQGELLKKSAGEVPVDSPIDSKPLKEIKQMLDAEKDSTSKDENTFPTFYPKPSVRNGFRR